MDSKSKSQHFFAVLEFKLNLVEVTAASRVAFDAIDLSNLPLFAVEETALAFHAENDRFDFVFPNLIQVVSRRVVLCCNQLICLLEVFRFQHWTDVLGSFKLHGCPDVVNILVCLALFARIEE